MYFELNLKIPYSNDLNILHEQNDQIIPILQQMNM